MMTRSSSRATSGKMIKDVIEDPCIAQCIAQQLLQLDDEDPSAIFAALKAFGGVSNDARFREAIEPEITIAWYRKWFKDWTINTMNITAKLRFQAIGIVNANKLRKLIQESDKERTAQYKQMCAFMIRHKRVAIELGDDNDYMYDLMFRLVGELPEFEHDGRLFIKEFFPLKIQPL
tara:strand:- start:747 stop:1274 length:528 start_codon:yes stop_codon:yes gene_type:complete